MIDNPYITSTPLPWLAENAPAALCADADANPDDWFPASGQRPAAAVALCRQCPLQHECAQWALTEDPDGVWGGLTVAQRQQLTRITRRSRKATA